MRLLPAALCVVACSTPTPSQSPLPPLFNLSASDTLVAPGDILTLDIDMPVPPAPSRIQVFLPRTDGQAGEICHPVLAGDCLDITGQLAIEGPVRTRGGVASFDYRIPANTTDERVQFQALVFTPSGPVASNAVTVAIEPPNTVRSSLYPRDWDPDYTDSTGRFLHDFSYAGYHHGEDPIPDITGPVFNVVDQGAVGDDTGDQTAAIRATIALAEAAGGVVYFPAGTYRIADQLLIRADGVVLRGEGDLTRLHFTRTNNMSDQAHIWFQGTRQYGTEVPAVQDIASRSHELEVADASGLAVGDHLDIGWTITPEFITDHGMTGVWGPFNSTWQPFFQRQITDIIDHGTSSTVVLDVPHRYDGLVRDGVSIKPVVGYISEVGIENLTFSNAQAVADAMNNDRNHVVRMDYVRDGWVRDVHTVYIQGENDGQVQSGGVMVARSKAITVVDSSFERAQNRGEGGNGYLVEVSRVSDVLIERVEARHGRHNLIQNWGFGATGIVWKDCVSEDSRSYWGPAIWQWLPAFSEFHHSLATANLIEGGTLNDGWKAENRGTYSSGAGHSATENVFWNVGGNGTISSLQYGWGYVIAPAPTLTVNTRRLGAVVGAPEDHVETFGAQQNLQPASLYRDQLARRLAR